MSDSIEKRLVVSESAGLRLFHMRKAALIAGAAGTVLFGAGAVSSFVFPFLNLDGSFRFPWFFAAVVGPGYVAFAVLSLWILLAYFRSRLYVGEDVIHLIGCFRQTKMSIRDVVSVRWRPFPAHGALVLRDGKKRLVIDFGDYSIEQRRWLIEHFRTIFNEQIQQGWERFEARWFRKHDISKGHRRSTAVTCGVVCFAAAGIIAMLYPGWPDDRRYYVYVVIEAVLIAAGAWPLVWAWRHRRDEEK